MTILSKKILASLLGAGLGYIYWYYWGCSAGCSITSVWWRTSIWGAIMGYLLNDILQDYLSSQSNEPNVQK